MNLKKRQLILVTCCCLATALITKANADELSGLDKFVKQVMEASGTPGVAISVVRGDETLAKGYGVLEAGKNEQDGHTDKRPDLSLLYEIFHPVN